MSIEAVLFDMDGVLASVGSSYRESIIRTAAHFGVEISHEDISIEKKKGNANNDWVLSKRLIDSRRFSQVEVSLDEVTTVFEDIYQGGFFQIVSISIFEQSLQASVIVKVYVRRSFSYHPKVSLKKFIIDATGTLQ